MKALKLGLLLSLLGCLPAVGAVTPVLPAPLVGSFQALLHAEADVTGKPAGLLVVTTMATGKVSGKLTTDENKTYAFTSTLNYTADAVEGDNLAGTSVSPTIEIARGKLAKLNLSLTLLDQVEDGPVLQATLNTTGETNRVSQSGFRVKTYGKTETAATMGAYTLAFEVGDELDADVPAGSGYAVGVIDAKGVLKLTGKTGDGTAFTFAAPGGPSEQFLVYLNPYKRAGSFFGGKLVLTPRSDELFHVLPAETGFDFQWAKTSLLPKTTDKSYRAAFGPVNLIVSMEPWKQASSGQTLASILGINSDEVFNFNIEGEFDLVKYSRFLPSRLGLLANSSFRMAGAMEGAPSPILPSLWSKIISAKLDAKTGKITATVNIEDNTSLNPLKPKIVKRKLVIEGVMLQLEEGTDSPFAQGFVQVPPLDAKTGTLISDRFVFNGPVVEDPYIAMSAATAGTYSLTVKQEVVYDFDDFDGPGVSIDVKGELKNIPADNAQLQFTLSPDLASMTFNGRKIPLIADGRPYSLLYGDVSASNVKNTLTVTMYLDTGTGLPAGLFAHYVQLLPAKVTVTVPGYGTHSANALIPAGAGYDPIGDIVKVGAP